MAAKNDLFDWKQNKLWRISSAAEVLSSIVIIIYFFLAWGEAYRYNQLAHSQFQTDLFGLFSRQPIYILDVSLQMSRVLVQGAFYYLVLRSVALGLNMILETDINYGANAADEGAE